MIRDGISIAAFIFLAGCNTGQATNDAARTDSPDSNTRTDQPVTQTVSQQSNQFPKEKIMGIWTDGSDENATFQIEKDSIYYVEQLVRYRYQITMDSIKIYYTDDTFSARIDIVNDTMFMYAKSGEGSWWRFKN